MRSRRVLQSLGVATVAIFVAAGCGSSSKGSSSPTTASGGSSATTASRGAANTASAPGITPTTVTMGFVYDETGIASSTFADAINGAQARIAAQNANGGVNGRTIKIVSADTTSSPTGANTAAQTVVQEKGAFAVDEVSALFFGAYKSLQQQRHPGHRVVARRSGVVHAAQHQHVQHRGDQQPALSRLLH